MFDRLLVLVVQVYKLVLEQEQEQELEQELEQDMVVEHELLFCKYLILKKKITKIYDLPGT
jgi:hypothetical protein